MENRGLYVADDEGLQCTPFFFFFFVVVDNDFVLGYKLSIIIIMIII